MTSLKVAGVCLVLVACGGDDRPGTIRNPDGTGGRRSMTGTGGAGALPDDGGVDGGEVGVPGAPVVTIVSPLGVADPNDGDVLVDDNDGTPDDVTVLCTAVEGNGDEAAPVDESTVKIELLDADGMPVGMPVAGVPTAQPGEYSADFILSMVPAGRVSFRCTASDTNDPPLTGTDRVDTFVDHGPGISVTSPAEGTARALNGVVPFDFDVDPVSLAAGDNGAAVTGVTLTVAGIEVPVTEGPDGTYTVGIDFNDKVRFPNTPTGSVPVVIRATNERGVQSAKSYSFTLDGTGPAISIQSPGNTSVIGGRVTLKFKVTDPGSGVDPASVVVLLNEEEHGFNTIDEWTRMGDDFTYTFDSRNITGSQVQVTINVRARDLAGNPAEGVSLIAYLDNYPPIVDLDPENVREWRYSGGSTICSASFDPLGASPNDLAPIQRFIGKLRALVWEQTNSVPGQIIHYFSGMRTDSVQVFAQRNAATALLVDTNDDDVCDEIDTTQQFTALKPISPAGASFFDVADVDAIPLPGTCELEKGSNPTNRLCNNDSDLYRVIRQTEGSGPQAAAIYGVDVASGVACTGTGWEIPNLTQEGWVCLAARALDIVGNVGVSPPLRVCYDDGVDPPSPCMTGTPPPTCTDGCTPPAGFGPVIVEQ